MFQIGFAEVLLCLLVALIVLGPQRLPTTLRALGRLYRRYKHFIGGQDKLL